MRNRWPKEMPYYGPSNFAHEGWCVTNDGGVVARVPPKDLSPKDLEAKGCGSTCCLVGAVRHAFGLPAYPGSGGPLPEQGKKFLRKVCENLGRPIPEDTFDVEFAASDAFEGNAHNTGTVPDFQHLSEITPAQASRAYRKALQHFGYTEDA